MINKVSVLLLLVILSITTFTSCNGTSTATTGLVTITDDLGRMVTLTSNNPQRIVSLAPSNTEILFALGLGDRIVGVTEYCNYPEEAKSKPKIGGYSDPNIEALVAAKPDLILGTEAQSEAVYAQIESKGLPIIGIYPRSINDILSSITMIGKITGKEKEAAKLTESMEKRIHSVIDKTNDLSADMKLRTFYIVWNDPLMSAGKGTFINELIEKAGGTNIFANLEYYPVVSLEDVLMANPQVIIAGSGMGEGADLPLQFALMEDRLEETDARKNERVYSVNTDIVGRPGPRIVDALEDFLAAIHPELRNQP